MCRGYWSVLFALAGSILLIAAAPKGRDIDGAYRTQASIIEASKEIGRSIQEAAKPGVTSEPCVQGQDHRYSDLCAQWKAADAAKAAAGAAWIALLIGSVTLVAAGMAAKYAKDAAEHTENGANAAWAALRPHIYVSALESNLGMFLDGRSSNVVWKLRIVNAGGGPAKIRHYHVNLSIVQPSGESGGTHTPAKILNSAFVSGFIEDFEVNLTEIVKNKESDLRYFIEKNVPMIAISTFIRYVDAAGGEHTSGENWRIFPKQNDLDDLKSEGVGPNHYT